MKFNTFTRKADVIKSRLSKLKDGVVGIHKEYEKLQAGQAVSQRIIQKLRLNEQEVLDKSIEFDTLLDSLITTTPDDDTDYKQETVNKIQDEIAELKTSTLSFIRAMIPRVQSENVPARTPVTSDVSLTTASVQLPKLDLPHFNGDLNNWMTFYNMFNVTINENAQLNAIQRFTYLLSCLEGAALTLVKSLPLTTTNYKIAWDILCQRYHSKRRLMNLHLNKIIDLPDVLGHSLKSLRQFLSSYRENSQALQAFGYNVSDESPLLVTLLLRKIDMPTRKKFEDQRTEHTLPQINDLIAFLEDECISTEDSIFLGQSRQLGPKPVSSSSQSQRYKTAMLIGSRISCTHCSKEGHLVFKCFDFKSKTPQERMSIVEQHNWCKNCLGSGHLTKACESDKRCHKCNKLHHTLLHADGFSYTRPFNDKRSQVDPKLSPEPGSKKSDKTSLVTISTSSDNKIDQSSNTSTFVGVSQKGQTHILLATALVKVEHRGIVHILRACLDTAAMGTFITQHAAQILEAQRSYAPKHISGINKVSVKTYGTTVIQLSSLDNSYRSNPISAIILENICADMPATPISPEVKNKMKTLKLADKNFDIPGPIDILLGADIFPSLLTGKTFSLGPNLPVAIDTRLGVILMGSVPVESSEHFQGQANLTLLFVQDAELHESIQRFWKVEEPPMAISCSDEDKWCEEHYATTHTRDASGRYTVRLPKKEDNPPLGDSNKSVKRQFLALEKRLESQPVLKTLYINFMKDYEEKGHMLPCENPPDQEEHFYLPHHGVLREQSSTTKLRVVFNGSHKTSNGVSLNDVLSSGPKLQTDISDIIFRFRIHNIVFSCDIKMMFRMINVHPEDQKYQLIFWRNSPLDELKTFMLSTVTYGLTSSPFQAIRTLRQLANDEGHAHPQAAKTLLSQTYTDDILAGASTLHEAQNLKDDLNRLLQKGGFSLRKWISNSSELLESIPNEYRETPLQFISANQPCFSILGLNWNPTTDKFFYNISIEASLYTKRTVLSLISRLFDPCGWLSPVIFLAKSFMQALWISGLGWDEALSPDMAQRWSQFYQGLPTLSSISISRPYGICKNSSNELHGFSDASELGFSACVYVRTCDIEGNVKISLLIAKSRVAPLKKISLPRLELNGAHLLAKLMNYCVTQLSSDIKFNGIYAWCDSTVTLYWIRTPPYRLKTYIGNRVAQIQEWVIPTCWAHVASSYNPADCASRGLQPSQLENFDLWWNGPTWLKLPHSKWPTSKLPELNPKDLPELTPTQLDVLVSTTHEQWNLLTKFSNWNKLLCVMAWILRFVNNCRSQQKIKTRLTQTEMKNSTIVICKIVQSSAFSSEVDKLRHSQACSIAIQRLSPFIDENGLMRVGGRLIHSNLDSEAKHPILLPKSHFITDLIIDHFHVNNLHAGPQLLQSLLSQQFWILSSRRVIRSRIFKCVRCFRCKPVMNPPLMGDLPKSRSTPARVFSRTGMDYGGPFKIKASTLKKAQLIKSYLCIFVCFTTKAVHLEVVTDLSTDSFLAALTRFVSRRGLCSDLFSDCGTNFVGASNQLRQTIQSFLKTKGTQDALNDFATHHSINFHFNPPSGPHLGGLWESAIKSAKYHLQRVVGDYIMTLEEFITISTKVEAVLNSRPLVALSSDPSEYPALTPGHFLIGAPLLALPEPKLEELPMNRLKRWQVVNAFTQRLWKRWSAEYLNTLQQRVKWTQDHKCLNIDDVVIVHEPDTPPLQWCLGRVVKIFPGADHKVRVVEILTSRGIIKRPSVKLFPLPLQ